jgi:hypothetical protein
VHFIGRHWAVRTVRKRINSRNFNSECNYDSDVLKNIRKRQRKTQHEEWKKTKTTRSEN